MDNEMAKECKYTHYTFDLVFDEEHSKFLDWLVDFDNQDSIKRNGHVWTSVSKLEVLLYLALDSSMDDYIKRGLYSPDSVKNE